MGDEVKGRTMKKTAVNKKLINAYEDNFTGVHKMGKDGVQGYCGYVFKWKNVSSKLLKKDLSNLIVKCSDCGRILDDDEIVYIDLNKLTENCFYCHSNSN